MEQVEQVTRQLVRMPESCPWLGMSEALKSACPNRRLLYPFCLRLDQCHLSQEGHLESGGSLAMWCRSRKFMMHGVAYILSSMEKVSDLELPILYVFPSLSTLPNTCKGKRPGNKYAKKKKNHWKNKKEQNSEPPQSGSLGGAFH